MQTVEPASLLHVKKVESNIEQQVARAFGSRGIQGKEETSQHLIYYAGTVKVEETGLSGIELAL